MVKVFQVQKFINKKKLKLREKISSLSATSVPPKKKKSASFSDETCWDLSLHQARFTHTVAIVVVVVVLFKTSNFIESRERDQKNVSLWEYNNNSGSSRVLQFQVMHQERREEEEEKKNSSQTFRDFFFHSFIIHILANTKMRLEENGTYRLSTDFSFFFGFGTHFFFFHC